MHRISFKPSANNHVLSKAALIEELNSCGGQNTLFLKSKSSIAHLDSPGTSYLFSKIRNGNDGRCFSITNCTSESEKDSFLLSFGAKGSACLTDHSKLPLMIIRGKQLASFLGCFNICPVQPTLTLSTSKVLLKIPSNLTFSKSKGNRAIISISSSNVEKTLFSWNYQADDSWRLTSVCNPLHTIATFRFPYNHSPNASPTLDFYMDLPRDLALLFMISVGFIVYK